MLPTFTNRGESMKRLIIFLMAAGCAASYAQSVFPPSDQPPTPWLQSVPHPALVMPSLTSLLSSPLPTGCSTDLPPQIGTVKQDPVTLYYSANVYAHSLCYVSRDQGYVIYEGCALVQWDPTGTTHTVSQLIFQDSFSLEQGRDRQTAPKCWSNMSAG